MKQSSALLVSFLSLAGCSSTEEVNPVPTNMPPEEEPPPEEETPAALDCAREGDKCYVRVKEGRFFLDGKPYQYMGANYWQAPYVSLDRLRTDLDLLQKQGVKNLRIMALSEGGLSDAEENDQVFGPQRIIPASSDEPCADPALEAYAQTLKRTLDEVHKRGMKAVLTLNDWYQWSGGMLQYMKWSHDLPDKSCGKSYDAYTLDGVVDPDTGADLLLADHHQPFAMSTLFMPGTGTACMPVPVGAFVLPAPGTLAQGDPKVGQAWNDLGDVSTLFLCNKKAQEFYFDRASRVIAALKDHPAIMAWQLANEPRSFKGWNPLFRRWVERNAKFIKDIDPNHLVSIGSEGDLYQWGDYANSDYEDFSAVPEVDYLTCHVWPENWGWYNPSSPEGSADVGSLSAAITESDKFIAKQLENAKALKKPMVVEEFGLARDDKSQPVASTVARRNKFYQSMFQHVVDNPAFAGVNFWAFAGAGRPAGDGNPYWRVGDDYIGDPPHEYQGWYSVYDTDTSTLDLIKEYAGKIEARP